MTALSAVPDTPRLDVAALIERETSIVDPLTTARRFVQAMPPAVRTDALVQALALLLQHRPLTRPVDPPDPPSAVRSAPASAPSPSWKVAAIRADWQRRLESSVLVGARYIALRDCTAEHLRTAASRFMELAKDNQAHAAELILCAEAVEFAKAGRLGDLPVDRLRELLGGAS